MKRYRITINGKTYEVEVEEINAGQTSGEENYIVSKPVPQHQHQTMHSSPQASKPSPPKPEAAVMSNNQSSKGAILAPMPGSILAVKVNIGQQVKAGDLLLILEAMKMENEVVAPVDGIVKELPVNEGDAVNTGDLLVLIS